ncbi:MAG: DUF4159 domain-containing protein [Planctomycetota bacterium]|jgi:hypothetical protein
MRNAGGPWGTSDLELGRAAEELAGGIERIEKLSRRRFLARGAAAAGGVALGSLAGLLGPRAARADDAVTTGRFIFPRLQFAIYDETTDLWNTGPIGDVYLKKHLRKLTNINVSPDPKVVRLSDFNDMVRHPFVFMTSEGYFKLVPKEERNLREFLDRGGFILADDCVYNAVEDRFFRCYRDLLNRLFPDNPMREVPLDHEIFHIYYDFPDGCPHMQGVRAGRSNASALFERGTGRIMTFATPGDIHCGWMFRYWGNDKNMAAVKMGINVIIYFLSH